MKKAVGASAHFGYLICQGLSQYASLAESVWTRIAHSNRSVHVVREDCERCPGSKWQAK
ncbi:conserved hypothetical protein [Klebsiella grimontii]|uniref:Uncharacterized protein n=1 Tax=Klebsiella grimontii TaxID=2058152 RepID=A0A285AZH3_9ENTR|nr:conserved hypothetical protein [Klebsiella grimontii]